jgi:hypothetical protein
MIIAYELKMTMREFYNLVDQDELGWWHAFFKVKGEKEEKERARSRSRSRSRRPSRAYYEDE